MIRSFQDPGVWQRAHGIVLEIYRATTAFPRTEQFGVVAQVRRASYSIPANIAEGFGRRSTKEFTQFLAIANGSLEETRYFLLLSKDLGYLSTGDCSRLDKQLTSVAQMLAALTRSLNTRIATREAERSSRTTGHGSRATRAPSGVSR